jgi:hypothetical protein
MAIDQYKSTNMNKTELIQKCKEMGIKGVSSKTKNEIMTLLNEHYEKQNNTHIQTANAETKPIKSTEIFTELLQRTPIDKSRKVCKNCHEIGHNITSTTCKINIDKNDKLKCKIKKYILSQNCLENKTIEEHCIELSVLLNITPNMCKSLYNEIPVNEIIDRYMDFDQYLLDIDNITKKCEECGKKIVCIQMNTHRVWNEKQICDACWHTYDDERKILWEKIKEYKNIQCNICGCLQTCPTERFHYDHLNMFDKNGSICNMVNEGVNISSIYAEINKCQILCLSCHHIITDIEHKIGFTRIKQLLTRKLNHFEMTEQEYNAQTMFYQQIYEEKMNDVYKNLQKYM